MQKGLKDYIIPYGEKTVTLQIPESRVAYFAKPVKPLEIPDQDQIIEQAIENPIQTDKLDTVSANKQVAILVDDITRPTPVKKILPHIIKRLHKAGIPDSNIKIVIALGTHRQLTSDELLERLGKNMINRYKIVNLDYNDKSNFVTFGVLEKSIPIEIYREVYNCDYKIAIGNIVPHMTAGWGGGAKMIQPGICSETTTEYTHLMASLYYSPWEICGIADNPVRIEIEKIAAQIGLDFIVNTVLDENKNILGVFAGHYIGAHREGVKFAERLMCPQIERRAPIVVVSANPCERDYWQASKPLTFSLFGVEEGGTIIFLLDAPEGISGNAPRHELTMRKWCLMPFERLKQAAMNKEEDDMVGFTEAINSSKLLPIVNVICISDNLSVDDKAVLGFKHVDTIEQAIEQATKTHGEDSQIGIIPYGGETLVKLRK
jgi:nickel-dependent lactate racemase